MKKVKKLKSYIISKKDGLCYTQNNICESERYRRINIATVFAAIFVVSSLHCTFRAFFFFAYEIPGTLATRTGEWRKWGRGRTLERIKKLLKFRKHEFFINEKLSNPPFAYTMSARKRERAGMFKVSGGKFRVAKVVKFLMIVAAISRAVSLAT